MRMLLWNSGKNSVCHSFIHGTHETMQAEVDMRLKEERSMARIEEGGKLLVWGSVGKESGDLIKEEAKQ